MKEKIYVSNNFVSVGVEGMFHRDAFNKLKHFTEGILEVSISPPDWNPSFFLTLVNK